MSAELLERADDLTALHAALADAAGGAGAVALVSGEAGIGKTSLVARFAHDAASCARVLWGACDALFAPRPLGPLHDMARQAGGRLGATVTESAGREAIFGALLDELQRARAPASGRAPTVLVFEDVHWADEATLDLLKFLGRRVARLPALVVLTYRDDEVGLAHPLRLVLGELPPAVVRRLPLRPLSHDAVAALARRAGRPAEGLWDATGGNPFFVTEAIGAGGHAVPVAVRDAVLARVARLSPGARQVVELASVVPTRIEAWLLHDVLAPAPAALEECEGIGMARHADGALAFRHELARRAVEDALPAERRRQLHARCLRALLARPEGAAPARLVHHAHRAGDADAVLRLAPVAAEQAAALGAHREAAAHLGCALEHAGALPSPERARLLERRAYECYLTDLIEDAATARRAALDIWRARGDARREGDTLRWLSRLSWFLGDRAAADRYAAAAVATLEPLPPGPELAMAYSNRAQLAMLADDVDAAAAWGGRAIALAERLGDHEILAHALNNVGTAEYAAERPGGRERLERSLAIALAHGLQEHVARAYTNLGSMGVIRQEDAAAMAALDAGIAYSDERDLDSWTLYMSAWRARLRFERGDWAGASDDAERVAGRARVAAVARIPAMTVLARLRLHRGDPGWRALLDEARGLAAGTDELQRVGPVACARAEAAWLHGDPEGAAAELAPALALGARQRVRARAAELALWLRRAGRPWPAATELPPPYAQQVAGDWRAAAAAWAGSTRPLEQAYALAEAAEEAPLRQALAILERLGSVPGAALVRRRLHDLGARRVPRGARASTRHNPAGLTTRQVEILALLGEGLRNGEIATRLFLSPKTVDHHVSAILGKLGVRTRGEAAAAARRLGMP